MIRCATPPVDMKRRGQDEERDRQQGEMPLEGLNSVCAIEASELSENHSRNRIETQPQGNGDRHADQHQADHHDEKKSDFHYSCSPFWARSSQVVFDLVAGDQPIALAAPDRAPRPARNAAAAAHRDRQHEIGDQPGHLLIGSPSLIASQGTSASAVIGMSCTSYQPWPRRLESPVGTSGPLSAAARRKGPSNPRRPSAAAARTQADRHRKQRHHPAQPAATRLMIASTPRCARFLTA